MSNIKFIKKHKKEILKFPNLPITHNFKKNIKSLHFSFKPILEFNYKNNFIHLSNKCSIKKLNPKYKWLNCYEPEKHLDKFVTDIIKLNILKKNQKLFFFSFKDKSLAQRFKNFGFNNLKFLNPIKDLKIKKKFFLIENIQYYFTKKGWNLKHLQNRYDFVFARHVFEHTFNINIFFKNLISLLKNDGYLMLEIPDCSRALKYGDPTMYWEEHNYYFSKESFEITLKKFQYEIIYLKKFKDSLENCLVAVIKKKKKYYEIFQENHRNYLKNYYLLLSKNINETKKYFKYLNIKGNIAIYGASHLSITFIEMTQINKMISLVIDDDKNKKGLFLPNSNLKINTFNSIKDLDISFFFLGLNPNHHQSVIKKINLTYPKSKIFSIFPGTKRFYGNYIIRK